MNDRFVVLAGDGPSEPILAALGEAGLGASTSLAAVSDPHCAGVILLAPIGSFALAAARQAVVLHALPVYAFSIVAPPPSLSLPGLWERVKGSSLWSTAWRWVPDTPFLHVLQAS